MWSVDVHVLIISILVQTKTDETSISIVNDVMLDASLSSRRYRINGGQTRKTNKYYDQCPVSSLEIQKHFKISLFWWVLVKSQCSMQKCHQNDVDVCIFAYSENKKCKKQRKRLYTYAGLRSNSGSCHYWFVFALGSYNLLLNSLCSTCEFATQWT